MTNAHPDLGENPTYRRDAYARGPFTCPPFEMRDRHYEEPTPPGWAALSDDQKSAEYGLVWLLGALDAHGVAVGSYDCEVALVIAEEGLSLAQVVAGWIARAGAADGPEHSSECRASGTFPSRSRLR